MIPSRPPGWSRPARTNRCCLYLHGGGFVFGSLRTHGTLIGALARAARARTLAIEYRLAPEHPAPAALEDDLASYRHLLAEGISPGRIVIAGDSAGGNLVLMTLLALRDGGDPLPAAGVAISPWVDLSCSRRELRGNAAYDFGGRPPLPAGRAGLSRWRRRLQPWYLAAVCRAGRIAPLLVHAGQAEVPRRPDPEFTTRARAAGVAVTFKVYDDMVHVWHLLRDVTPLGQVAIDEIGAFVRECTASHRSII